MKLMVSLYSNKQILISSRLYTFTRNVSILYLMITMLRITVPISLCLLINKLNIRVFQ